MNSANHKLPRTSRAITKACGLLSSISCLVLAGLPLPVERATAGDIELLVPAYANPCCSGGPTMWSTLISTAQTASTTINIILNPASGPGASSIDPKPLLRLCQHELS